MSDRKQELPNILLDKEEVAIYEDDDGWWIRHQKSTSEVGFARDGIMTERQLHTDT